MSIARAVTCDVCGSQSQPVVAATDGDARAIATNFGFRRRRPPGCGTIARPIDCCSLCAALSWEAIPAAVTMRRDHPLPAGDAA